MLTRTPLHTGYAYQTPAYCTYSKRRAACPEAYVWRTSLGACRVHCAPRHQHRQRDASITVRDADGELLLIEAAYCLPRWLTPEVALNRVFLRQGEVRLVPKAVAPRAPQEPLQLSRALPAVRADTPALRCAAVTAAVRARVEPLLHDARGVARGPPRHRARC